MDASEAVLIRRCKARDREAFGALVKKYAARAIGAAALLLGDRTEALDASQDAFIRAWRNIRRFDGRASFYTWYSTILRNTCISRLRRRARRKTIQLPEAHTILQPQSDPVLLAERNEETERIWRAILELQTIHREMIVMSHFQDMSYKHIADVLGIPIGTVASRLYKAREALRKKLEGEQV